MAEGEFTVGEGCVIFEIVSIALDYLSGYSVRENKGNDLSCSEGKVGV